MTEKQKAKNKNVDWSLIIAFCALGVSVLTAGLSFWHTQKLQESQQAFENRFQQIGVLEEAKIEIVKNAAQINGILIALNHSQNIDISRELPRFFKLHAENRNLYNGIKHHFNDESQEKLDQFLDEIRNLLPPLVTPNSLPVNLNDKLQKLYSFSKLLLEEIDKKLLNLHD